MKNIVILLISMICFAASGNATYQVKANAVSGIVIGDNQIDNVTDPQVEVLVSPTSDLLNNNDQGPSTSANVATVTGGLGCKAGTPTQHRPREWLLPGGT